MTSTNDFINSFREFNAEQVDRRIGTWIRQFSTGSVQDWQSAENILMRVLLDLALLEPEVLDLPSGSKFEVVANALARALGNCDRETDYSTDYLVTLSALSYAIAGNFPSAAVYAQRAKDNKISSNLENWMMKILSSKYFVLKDNNPPSDFVSYAIIMDEALKNGQKDDYNKAIQELDRAIQNSIENISGKDKFLLLLWKLINKRFEQLSAARVLKELGFQNQAFIESLIDETLMLYPSQVHTLTQYPLIKPGDPLFISLPTSTGKSLLGEIALVSSLSWDRSRWLGVYLAPYRALTDQLQARMRKRLRKIGITCVIRRGGYLAEEMNIDEGKPTILVATPEAFDALLRVRPQLYKNIAACVFDEFHLIEQQQRGLRYEGILGRFLSGASGNISPKIIALSAVVQDTDNITKWLQTSKTNVSNLPWIPTSRKLAIVSPDGIVRFFSPGENLDDSTEDVPIWEGKIDLPHTVSRYPKFQQEKNNLAENIASVAVDQWQRFKQPVLVLSSTRIQTRQIARIISGKLENNSASKSSTLADEIAIRFPFLYSLQGCLNHKVAYHNASLPDWVRSRIEKLIQEKELKVVVATTTLAEGVDLPFRAVVLADWKQWSLGTYQAMPSLLFRNIAGRCGRAWEFSEGDTLIVDSPDKKLIKYKDRYKTYIDNYIKPTKYGLNSSLKRENEIYQSITPESQSVLESQYVAYIAACEKVEDTEEKFSSSLYASTDENTRDRVVDSINKFTKDMLNEVDYPVLERNSPLNLTEFGTVALKTGLSPKSSISLIKFLRDYSEVIEPRIGKKTRGKYNISWEPLINGIWRYYPSIQELQNRQIDSYAFPVKSDNFLLTTMAWISGTPFELIAYILYTGKEKKEISSWLSGNTESLLSKFEDDIDQVAVFCKQYLSEQWSWVFRGASIIAENTSVSKVDKNILNGLALRLQYGVKNLATVKLLQARNCPIDRAKLDWLITSYQPINLPITNIALPNFIDWLKKDSETLPDIPLFRSFPRIGITSRDLEELIDFLEKRVKEEQ